MKCAPKKNVHPLSDRPASRFDQQSRWSAGDRRTGISAAQDAANASANVHQCGLSGPKIAALALNFADAAGGFKPNLLPAKIKTSVRNASVDHHAEHYMPHATVRKDVAHKHYVDHLLSSSANRDLLGLASEVFLGKTPNEHARELDELRLTQPAVYAAFIRGRVGSGLRTARKLGACVFQSVIGTAVTHTRLFMLKTAYDKLHAIRSRSVNPNGPCYAGTNSWPSMGHVVLNTVTSPALVIQSLMKLATGSDTAILDDNQLFQHLVDNSILSNDKRGSFVFEVAQVCRDLIVNCPRRRGEMNFTAAMSVIKQGTLQASLLRRGDIRAEGLARLSFVEDDIGLSASEAAAYLAIQLLRGAVHVDACLDAIRRGVSLPAQPSWQPSSKPAAFASMILRAEVRPDKNAPKLGEKVGLDTRHLDESRGSGRGPVEMVFRKLEDPQIAARAVKELGIDATFWLKR